MIDLESRSKQQDWTNPLHDVLTTGTFLETEDEDIKFVDTSLLFEK